MTRGRLHIFVPFDIYIMGILFDNLFSVSWEKNIDMYGSVLGSHTYFGDMGGGGVPNFFYKIFTF
mgnify:CR=1 FL=1